MPRRSGVVALVPARGGSKGLPGKNIRPLGGFPLIAYSIVAARLCPLIDRVVLTTDAPDIAEVGRRFGAEVPFLRPAALSGDTAGDRAYIVHFLDWLLEHEDAEPDLLVQLRPTTPLRDPAVLAEAVRLIRDDSEATSLRSAQPVPEPPQKMMGIEDGWLVGLFPHDPRPEYFNLPRQSFPPAYTLNAYVDIVRPRVVRDGDGVYGGRMRAMITPPTVEIDTIEEFDYLDYIVTNRGHVAHDALTRMTLGVS